ncbi:formin-like protein 3 [Oryza sativa Japonica Group]|uniref:formin-like protein 3 n=1 Tax=Oryza sativa subsp. japonica TaxID=39947 RepID=UPI00339BD190
MYFVERYLSVLKSYVRNKAHPEGCIAEAYLADESGLSLPLSPTGGTRGPHLSSPSSSSNCCHGRPSRPTTPPFPPTSSTPRARARPWDLAAHVLLVPPPLPAKTAATPSPLNHVAGAPFSLQIRRQPASPSTLEAIKSILGLPSSISPFFPSSPRLPNALPTPLPCTTAFRRAPSGRFRRSTHRRANPPPLSASRRRAAARPLLHFPSPPLEHRRLVHHLSPPPPPPSAGRCCRVSRRRTSPFASSATPCQALPRPLLRFPISSPQPPFHRRPELYHRRSLPPAVPSRCSGRCQPAPSPPSAPQGRGEPRPPLPIAGDSRDVRYSVRRCRSSACSRAQLVTGASSSPSAPSSAVAASRCHLAAGRILRPCAARIRRFGSPRSRGKVFGRLFEEARSVVLLS